MSTSSPHAPDSLSHFPFTQPWADALKAVINDDPDYRAVASGWKWPLALVLDRVESLGYPDDVAVRLDLGDGECREARIAPAADVEAEFVLRGPYGVWKRIVLGELDPMAAVVKQELELEGSLHTLLMNVKTAKALVACAQRVPTIFPDEA